METVTKKTVTNLTKESVSILTQQVYSVIEKRVRLETQTVTEYKTQLQEKDGELVEVQVPVEVEVQVPVEFDAEKEIQVGSNHRCAYVNSERGRVFFIEQEPEHIITEVMAVWGDTPTVEEPDLSDYTPEPTLTERVEHIEELLANSGSTGVDVWDAMAAAIEEGVNEV